MSRPISTTPAEASFFVSLYRAERAAALARGADIALEHPHGNGPYRANALGTWKPAIRIAPDGCYHITPLIPEC